LQALDKISRQNILKTRVNEMKRWFIMHMWHQHLDSKVRRAGFAAVKFQVNGAIRMVASISGG
jgi:hypothetical protein